MSWGNLWEEVIRMVVAAGLCFSSLWIWTTSSRGNSMQNHGILNNAKVICRWSTNQLRLSSGHPLPRLLRHSCNAWVCVRHLSWYQHNEPILELAHERWSVRAWDIYHDPTKPARTHKMHRELKEDAELQGHIEVSGCAYANKKPESSPLNCIASEKPSLAFQDAQFQAPLVLTRQKRLQPEFEETL